jgi:hypothetical protein
MNTTTKIISVSSIEQIPTLETIEAMPRGQILKLIFNDVVQNQRETIGQNLKNKLVGFQVAIHTVEPKITITKLITDQEIEDNQDFFEQCAKDYRQLGEELIFKLTDSLGLSINEDSPMITFNKLKMDKKQKGVIDNWEYFIHGFHCGFKNIDTGQCIEVSLVFGLEFGVLDSYFFINFIKSTPKYNPLPVDFFEEYADGSRIKEKMLSLGKFEKIGSNINQHYGIVVTNRKKNEIKPFEDFMNRIYEL